MLQQLEATRKDIVDDSEGKAGDSMTGKNPQLASNLSSEQAEKEYFELEKHFKTLFGMDESNEGDLR